MYTNIPCLVAANLTIEMAKRFNVDFYGLHDTDIFTLLKLVIDNNFFVFNGSVYKQVSGLPMGSRISGLLANIFIDHLESALVPNLPISIYKRYVDDIFILTKNEESAVTIARSFNDNEHGLIFELEKPTDNSLNLLDFGVAVVDGSARISFYQKPSRSNIFVNFNSHLPLKLKRNFAINEWNRILRKCKNAYQVKKTRLIFISKMVNNGYPMNLIKKFKASRTPH
jgi:hypothetical protein